MTHTLALLPPVQGLLFDEPSHTYTVEHKHLGTLVIPSVSQVMAATGGKCMNYSAWRQSLLRNGICESEADADAYMEQHRKHRAMVGTDFHHLSESELLGAKCRVVQEESRDAGLLGGSSSSPASARCCSLSSRCCIERTSTVVRLICWLRLMVFYADRLEITAAK